MACTVSSSVVDVFCALAAVESPSGRERPVAELVRGYLAELGLEADEDGAAGPLDGDCGNLLARIPATDGERGTPLFFCAHLDTVPPLAPVEPLLVDGSITNANDGILGADNKAAVAVVLEAARQLVQERIPHAGVELLFTVQEEVGLRGAKEFDVTRLHARTGYVYDHAAPIGEIVMAAPSQFSIHAAFHGRPAHAGLAPEQGRSAIAAASRGIARMRLGRIDDATTANVGVIAGGSARNVVPEHCTLEAEARSLDASTARALTQEMLDALALAASEEECTLTTTVVDEYEAYRLTRRDPQVALAHEALAACGIEPRSISSGGGADAHVFLARGLDCANLCNAMERIHTGEERIAVAAIEQMVRVTRALVEAARTRLAGT